MKKLLLYIIVLLPLHRSMARHLCHVNIPVNNTLDTTRSGGNCGTIGTGTLRFTVGNHITSGMQAQLSVLASQMRDNPLCKVVVTGVGSSSKSREQRSWEHANAVIEYMTEKNNIPRYRLIFKYEGAGDEKTVTYRPADSDEQNGIYDPPPPHPEIK